MLASSALILLLVPVYPVAVVRAGSFPLSSSFAFLRGESSVVLDSLSKDVSL